jgi:cbb3-type cytochrome oxidase subunit 3
MCEVRSTSIAEIYHILFYGVHYFLYQERERERERERDLREEKNIPLEDERENTYTITTLLHKNNCVQMRREFPMLIYEIEVTIKIKIK